MHSREEKELTFFVQTRDVRFLWKLQWMEEPMTKREWEWKKRNWAKKGTMRRRDEKLFYP